MPLHPRRPDGFTLIELLICLAITGILVAVSFNLLSGRPTDPKAECLAKGGTWSEGYTGYRPSYLCTYR
jgi:hypothetical protein